jgi:probable O-glycosylation ligase (exosortase A-associated)
MRSLLFILIFLFVCVLALRIPFIGYAFYYWLTISNADYFAYAPPYPWTKYAALITLVSFLLFEVRKCQPIISPIPFMIIVLALWISITTHFALFPEAARFQLETELKVLLMMFIGALLLTTPARLQATAWLVQAGMAIFAAKGTYIMVTGNIGATPGVPGALVGETNEAARALLYTIPLAMYLRVTSRQPLLRWGALAFAVLLSLSLLGTGSRGATVALFLIASLGVIRSRHRFRWLGVIGVIASIGASVTATTAFQNWWARFGTTSDLDEDQSFQERVEVWNNAFELIRNSPIVGGGFDVYEYAFNRASHNTYFEWAGEHGLVGLALFLTMLAIVWFSVGSTIRKTRNRPDLAWAWHLMQAVRYVLIAYLVGGLTKNDGFNELFFLIIAMAEGTRRVVNARVAAPVKAEAAGLIGRPRLAPAGAAGLREESAGT